MRPVHVNSFAPIAALELDRLKTQRRTALATAKQAIDGTEAVRHARRLAAIDEAVGTHLTAIGATWLLWLRAGELRFGTSSTRPKADVRFDLGALGHRPLVLRLIDVLAGTDSTLWKPLSEVSDRAGTWLVEGAEETWGHELLADALIAAEIPAAEESDPADVLHHIATIAHGPPTIRDEKGGAT